NKIWVQILAWVSAIIIVGLNIRLVVGVLGDWFSATKGAEKWLIGAVLAPFCALLGALLVWVTFEPWLKAWITRAGRAPPYLPESVGADAPTTLYSPLSV